jgi:hypothetical protein
MSKDFKALLAGAKLPEQVVPLCLRGDLAAEVERLDAELAQLQKAPGTSLAGNGSGALVEQIEAVQEQMREHTYPVRMRALPRAEWQALRAAHPPRVDADGEMLLEDRMSGVDRSTFFEPAVRASIVDPELTDAEWTDLVGKLTDRQFEDLVAAVWTLNQGSVSVPFSRAVSRARAGTDGE